MILQFKTKNEKQLKAAEYWIDNETEELLYGGAKGGGKAMPLTSKILTPFGWSTMGDMRVGSIILNPIGEQQTVIAIHPQGKKDIFKITFDDGSYVECCEEHLWLIRKIHKIRKTESNWRIQNTKQIIELFNKAWTPIAIPTTNELSFSRTYKTNQIKIAPYTLGVLLGDGCLRGSSLNFTTLDNEIISNVNADGYKTNQQDNKICYSIIETDIRNILRKWGLYNKKSEDKFIPEYYKWSSVSVRKELLAGLLDTDGTVDRLKGNACFTTVSKQLAEDVIFIIRSLGGRASISEKKPFYYDNERNKIDGLLAYNVWFSLPFNPFKLKRKSELYKTYPQDRVIISIENIGKKEAQCITVDNPNGLYLTDDFIVTHNSYLGASLIFGDALIYPDTHYFIARKELIDLRKFTVPTIHEVFKNWGIKFEDYAKFNGQDNVFDLYNGSKVFLISCSEIPSDPLFERFGSMQMTRGWEEEAGEIPEVAHRNLSLSVGRWKNDVYKLKRKILITANPKKGWMKRDFVDLFKQGVLPKNRKYIQAFATDNVYLPADYINALKNEKDLVRRQRLWEGDWEYDEDKDSMISFDALSDAFSNTITKDGQKYLIVDVARQGRDTTVFNFWNGLESYEIEVFSKQSTLTTEQQVKDFAAKERIPYSNIMIDEDGIGGGVVDHCLGVRGFVANSTPLQTGSQIRGRLSKIEGPLIPRTNFTNLKTQCAFKLAELINEHNISFKTPEYRNQIIEELTALLRQKNIDSDGKKQLKPKEEVKEELGKSPDIGDTFIMRAWFELRKDASNESPEMGRIIEQQREQFLRNKNNQSLNDTQ